MRFKAHGHNAEELGLFDKKEDAQAIVDALPPNTTKYSGAGVEPYYDRTWLCIEHGEEFTIDAKDKEAAIESASLWGAEVIKEIKVARQPSTKPQKKQSSTIVTKSSMSQEEIVSFWDKF